MPSKFTEHFNLNQWEKTDKVLMEDFNEDNAKLDEALTAHDTAIRNAHPVLLKTWTSGEAAKTLELDISGIEWAKYAWVVMQLHFPEKCGFYMDINGGGRYYIATTTGGNSHFSRMTNLGTLFRMICPVFYQDELPLQSLALEGFIVVSISNLPLQELKLLTLTVYNTTEFPAGTEFKVWGIQ